jgi:hypothetical protein
MDSLVIINSNLNIFEELNPLDCVAMITNSDRVIANLIKEINDQ